MRIPFWDQMRIQACTRDLWYAELSGLSGDIGTITQQPDSGFRRVAAAFDQLAHGPAGPGQGPVRTICDTDRNPGSEGRGE